jgi:hypothetical protein
MNGALYEAEICLLIIGRYTPVWAVTYILKSLFFGLGMGFKIKVLKLLGLNFHIQYIPYS